MTMTADDPRHQDFEVQWWGDCTNTFSEENKQLVYAHQMNLVQTSLGEKWPVYDLGGKNVVDIGGGPVSMLLKCINRGPNCTVIDPGYYPEWTVARYEHAGIRVVRAGGEEPIDGQFDEAWMYNCLQHTVDPEQIIKNARAAARVIRVAEWVEAGESLGHPHELHASVMDSWLDGVGTVTVLNQNGCHGQMYAGVFRGD